MYQGIFIVLIFLSWSALDAAGDWPSSTKKSTQIQKRTLPVGVAPGTNPNAEFKEPGDPLNALEPEKQRQPAGTTGASSSTGEKAVQEAIEGKEGLD